MKKCTTCNRTYTDESLSFCLDDGTPLVADDQNQGYDPGATLFMAEPPNLQTSQVEARTTADTPQNVPQQQTPSSPFSQPSTGQQSSSSPFSSNVQPSYQTPPPPPTWQPPVSASQAQPAKKRSFLPWVLAIIGLFVVGGLGLVLVAIVILSSNSNSNENNQNNDNKIAINKNANNSNNTNNTNKNTNNSNNTVNSNNAVDASFITDEFLAANSESGTSTTVFSPRNVIYYVYKIEDMPRTTTVVCRLWVDDAPPFKNISATDNDAEDKVNKGYSGTRWFKFTPATTGWPKGTYHVEFLEKKSDGSFDELKRIDLTVE